MTKTSVFTTVNSLQEFLSNLTSETTIGFVPTMGALHHGHLALVKESMNDNALTVVSIFVNPKQFNNSGDLAAYPRTMERDMNLLESLGGNIVIFAPTEDEMYPSDYEPFQLDLGGLATGMEGEFRPGHFDGVVKVIKRFFDIVHPQKSYYGMKDYQQLAVIRFLAKSIQSPVEIVGVETVRETSGLASSSRNERLNGEQLNDAVVIYQALNKAKEWSKDLTPKEVIQKVVDFFALDEVKLELEYFEICHPDTLQPIAEWVPGAHACTAALSGEVRLIDNMQLVPR